MSLLLDPSFVSADEDFNYVCGNPEERQFIEKLWERYQQYADNDFPQKIASRFHNHFWEMYLACTLADIGIDLIPKTKTEGPDIEIRSSDSSRIWVEAIAASPGQGADQVPLPKPDDEMFLCVPEEQIVLRYASALVEKYRKYRRYREKNIIAKSEPYIIAVNGNKVPYAWDDEIPYIVQAVLPIGLPTVWINRDAPEKFTTGYAHRPEINKVSGSSVPTNIFLQQEYEGISGVLFSGVDIHGFRIEMGSDFIFVHNPLALNKLPEGWLRKGREYTAVGNSLIWKCWPR